MSSSESSGSSESSRSLTKAESPTEPRNEGHVDAVEVSEVAIPKTGVIDTDKSRRGSGCSPAVWKPRVTFDVSHTAQLLVKEVISSMGFTVLKDSDKAAHKTAMVVWYNCTPPAEVFSNLQSFQKLNQFPGTHEISRKDNLARNLTRMQRVAPKAYNFCPRSWILPAELSSVKKHYDMCRRRNKTPTYIFKPPNMCQGKGILLVQNTSELPDDGSTVLVQEYLPKPFLIDGYKFDLRLYVLVTSYEPLRVFLYRDGLVRLATQKYKAPSPANLDKLLMHLTNYSLNKDSEDFDDNESTDQGTKRTIDWFMKYLADEGHDTEALWAAMADVILKTLIVAWPHNVHTYRARRGSSKSSSESEEYNSSNCFAILGFDLFLDKKLKPYIIEVNRAPSFAADAQLDRDIKTGVLRSAIKLLKLRPSMKAKAVTRSRIQAQARLLGGSRPANYGVVGSDRSAESSKRPTDKQIIREKQRVAEIERREYEDKNKGMYYRIYPIDDTEKMSLYSDLVGKSMEIFFQQGGTSVSADWFADSTHEARKSKTSEPKNGRNPATPYKQPPAKPSTKKSKPSLTTRFAVPQQGAARATSARRKEEVNLSSLLEKLAAVSIVLPTQTSEQTSRLIEEVKRNWHSHCQLLWNYWVDELDNHGRREVIDLVAEKVLKQIELLYTPPIRKLEKLRIVQVLEKVYDRLVCQNGQGMWNFFDTTRSRHMALSYVLQSTSASPSEHKICRRVVELAEQCVLAAYHHHQLDLQGGEVLDKGLHSDGISHTIRFHSRQPLRHKEVGTAGKNQSLENSVVLKQKPLTLSKWPIY